MLLVDDNKLFEIQLIYKYKYKYKYKYNRIDRVVGGSVLSRGLGISLLMHSRKNELTNIYPFFYYGFYEGLPLS